MLSNVRLFRGRALSRPIGPWHGLRRLTTTYLAKRDLALIRERNTLSYAVLDFKFNPVHRFVDVDDRKISQNGFQNGRKRKKSEYVFPNSNDDHRIVDDRPLKENFLSRSVRISIINERLMDECH